MPVSDEDEELLRRHLPQLRYHRLEPYRADSARLLTESFLESAYSNELRRRGAPGVLARSRPTGSTPALSLELLTARGRPYYPGGPKASINDFLAAHGGTLEEDAHRMRRRLGWADVVYCRRAPGKQGRSWLQYWFFYYDNPFRVGWLGAHQGDWEMIQVGLQGLKPKCVTYAQHADAERRDWDKAPRVGGKDRPVVYVAKRSHASYFTAGTQKRLPWALGLANDHTSDGGDRVDPTPYFLDEAVDRWLAWPGRWGSTWQKQDKSPPGPAFQGSWLAPETFHFQKATEGAEAPELGLEALAVQPAAPAALTAHLEGDRLVVEYAFALAPAAGETAPVRLELALYGAAGPPVARAYDVTAVDGRVSHPLPLSGPPYRLEAGVYDEEDRERLLATLPVSAAMPEAGLEGIAPAPVVRPALRRRPATMVHELRVLARAPEGLEDPAAVLARMVAEAGLGQAVIAPLFAPSDPARERELAAWYAVSFAAAPPPGSDLPATAFEAARALTRDGWEAEPDLPSTVFVPDPEGDEGLESLESVDPMWALKAINCPTAWRLRLRPGGLARGEGAVIGQPDTGFTDHPELELGALDRLRDYDVLTGRDDAHAVLAGIPPAAFPSHGTSTASVAVSRRPGEVTGAAPLAVVVPIRAATTVVHVHNGNLAAAIDYARELDVDVISISMGGIAYPAALRTAIQRAVARGIIVMAAAGQPLPLVVAPASYAECLAVGGTTQDDEPWGLSARGREVDWSAPAVKVPVAATRNSGANPYHVGAHSGTSFSVALSAGVAACWIAAHGGRRAVRERFPGGGVQWAFRDLVRKTARKPRPDWDASRHGAGIIDAAELLRASLDDADPKPPGPRPDAGPLAWATNRLAALLDREPEEARDRLEALVGGDLERVAPFAGEIVYRIAETPDLRAAFTEPPAEGLEGVAAPVARAHLAAVASPSLREALG